MYPFFFFLPTKCARLGNHRSILNFLTCTGLIAWGLERKTANPTNDNVSCFYSLKNVSYISELYCGSLLSLLPYSLLCKKQNLQE